MMHLLLTRHSFDFDPVTCELDPAQSPYAECYDEYTKKRHELARLVGTDMFLWCIPAKHKFDFFENVKLVEWKIRVSDNRILGFVNDSRWFQYLEGKDDLPRSAFSASNPPQEKYSVLVEFPLKREELVSKTVFRFKSSREAEILSEENFSEEKRNGEHP